MAKISRRLGRLGVDWRDAVGRRRWKSFKTEGEARVFLGEKLLETGLRATVDPSITLAEYSQGWLAVAAVRVTPAILASYQEALDLIILPAIGTDRLFKVTRPRLRRWLAAVLTCGVSPATARLAASVLDDVLAQAVEDGLLRENPASWLTRALDARAKEQSAGDT